MLPATAKEIEPANWKENAERPQFQLSMLTRMIFSCVVDGDYIDTDRFYGKIENRPFDRDTPKPTPTLLQLRAKLDAYLSAFKVVNSIDTTRALILTHARSHAGDRIGLFSLTITATSVYIPQTSPVPSSSRAAFAPSTCKIVGNETPFLAAVTSARIDTAISGGVRLPI